MAVAGSGRTLEEAHRFPRVLGGIASQPALSTSPRGGAGLSGSTRHRGPGEVGRDDGRNSRLTGISANRPQATPRSGRLAKCRPVAVRRMGCGRSTPISRPLGLRQSPDDDRPPAGAQSSRLAFHLPRGSLGGWRAGPRRRSPIRRRRGSVTSGDGFAARSRGNLLATARGPRGESSGHRFGWLSRQPPDPLPQPPSVDLGAGGRLAIRPRVVHRPFVQRSSPDRWIPGPTFRREAAP